VEVRHINRSSSATRQPKVYTPATNCSGALCNRRPGDQVLLPAPLPLAPKAPKKGDPAPSKNPKSYQFPLLATL
jgi:hypothetical protein